MRYLFLLLAVPLFAQKVDHSTWTLTADPASAKPGGKALVRAVAKIESPWHLYSASTPAGNPVSFQIGPANIVEKVRIFQTPPKRAFDANFGSDTETFDGAATFLLELQIASGAPAGPAQLEVKGRYQTCTDTLCVSSRYQGTLALTIDPAAADAVIPAGFSEARPPAQGSTGEPAPATEDSWASFLAVAFGFGLASVFTPCVFPMIPITMSFFLKGKGGLAQATVFCLGIVVLFSVLGLATTLLLGAGSVGQLGSNPWVNGFITLLFLTFGLSLLGAFEITIPSPILTRLNASSGGGGFVATLLMGLTFSLASFACVGPFVGTLLAGSVTGSVTRPLAGMMTFAAGLSLPFFLLALFPSYLKRLPRSGGWMARVKVVMGFVILASSLKYLASVDQVLQWGFLTRERFLAAWIVLFALAGLYLLGFVRLEGIKHDEPLGIPRLVMGSTFLIFAISLWPGMYGGKLGDFEAYVPVAGDGGGGLQWMKNQYREALKRARLEGKRVFVNFTGYACANCHWMKANMFTKPEIASAMKGFVLVELYGDGLDAASEENQKRQIDMFQTISVPFYAILDPDEKVLATFSGRTTNAAEFLAFLNKGAQSSAAPTTAAPKPAADSQGLPTVTALDGATIDANQFAGKVVVVNFWATWCVPCIKEIPSFNQLHREFASKGVAVLGVSMDTEGAERVRPFLKKHPMDYQVATGAEALNDTYKLDLLPVTIVFDRSGKPVRRFEGFTPEAELTAAVRAAL